MRISALTLGFLFFPFTAYSAQGVLCGLFNVEAYIQKGADTLVLNPEAVTRMTVKITNVDLIKKYEGRVVKAELWLKSECHNNCVGSVEKINGTVSPYQKVGTFSRQQELLIKEQVCVKSSPE